MAGAIYDRFAFYAPAFAVGVLFNLLNLAIIGSLVWRRPTIQPAWPSARSA